VFLSVACVWVRRGKFCCSLCFAGVLGSRREGSSFPCGSSLVPCAGLSCVPARPGFISFASFLPRAQTARSKFHDSVSSCSEGARSRIYFRVRGVRRSVLSVRSCAQTFPVCFGSRSEWTFAGLVFRAGAKLHFFHPLLLFLSTGHR
jgi:hypothetical protein